jgi:hypothetical protein
VAVVVVVVVVVMMMMMIVDQNVMELLIKNIQLNLVD